MKGTGVSGGALTVINAIATGFGSAFGIGLSTKAEVELLDEPEFSLEINGEIADNNFVKCLLSEFLKNKSVEDISGAIVKTESNIPMSMGLKSSSAAANSIILAMADAAEVNIEPIEAAKIGATASIKTGVSVTGAFDDACACILGGLVFTDNKKMELIKRTDMNADYSVVISLPKFTIETKKFPKEKFRLYADEVTAAYNKAMSGDIFSAMYENGLAVSKALDISNEISDRALLSGAAASGFSGTGPAVGILVLKDDLDSFLNSFGSENCIVTNIRNGCMQ